MDSRYLMQESQAKGEEKHPSTKIQSYEKTKHDKEIKKCD